MPFNGQGGQFPNMNFAGPGDFNQMQMMMAMQNGMQPNAFGGFPMMGEYFCRNSPLWTRSKARRNEYGPDGDAEHVHEHER